MQKLSEKDIRTLKLGGICAAVILVFIFGAMWLEHWSKVRQEIRRKEAELDVIDVAKAKQAGWMSIVPVFEMPEKEEVQKVLFRNKFNEQLKKAGIKSQPLKVVPTGKTLQKGYRLLNVQCTAKCKFTQALDLLARLNENPYLVGVEEFKIKCDKSKPQEVELNLTVSTAVLLR